SPLTTLESNVRWLCLPLLMFIAIGSTLLITNNEANLRRQWIVALAGLNIASVISLITADLIHLYFVPDATIYETFGAYKRNPAYIPINIVAVNIFGLLALAITSFAFFCLDRMRHRIP
ncbi:MAG: hypothetical protein ABJB40_14830, partial [Acidobacteriota bacterium]